MRRLVLAIACCLASFSVHAQPAATAPAEMRAQYDAAFQETLRKPSDPPTLIRYATIAVKVGDYEGAISALERLLLIENDQPAVRLELGLLYYRLGSYEAAKGYLEGAQGSARATPEIKSRAQEGLAEIARVHGPSRFSGDTLIGLRYSTNANSGPAGTIRGLGQSVVPSPTITRRPDFSAVAAGQLRHRWDPGRQDSGTLETDFGLYTARQFQVTEANVIVADLTMGPRFKPVGEEMGGLTLKPLLNARWVAVHDYTTYWAWGAGVEATTAFTDKLRGNVTVLGRHREFVNNPDVLTNDRSSGNEVGLYGGVNWVLMPQLLLTVGASAMRYTAVTAPESYWEYGASASLSWRFVDPVGINGRIWVATLSGGLFFADYDQPNIAVDTMVARRQSDYAVAFVLAVPMTEDLTLVGQASYNNRAASLTNYAYDAFNTMLGVSWRF